MKIESLAPSKRVKGRYLVHLDEGTLLRVTEQEVLDFGLFVGRELSPQEGEQLEKAGAKSQLKDKALGILSRKSISKRDLEKKLLEYDGTPEEIEEICLRLEDLGLIDDQRYAKELANLYHRKGYGERRITQELHRHGVPRKFWEESLEGLEDGNSAIDRYLSQKLKGEKPDPKQVKKVSEALARRGFSWSEIREGLVRYDLEMAELWEL